VDSCTEPRRRRGRRGQSLVEFAITAPILLVFLGITVDLGRGFSIGSQVSNASREGALFAAHHAATETSRTNFENDIKTVMQNEEQASPAAMKCPTALAPVFSYSPSTPTIPLAAGTTSTLTITVSCTFTALVNYSPDGSPRTVKSVVKTYLAN